MRTTRASARQSHCGPSCAFPMLAADTSTNCTTNGMPLVRFVAQTLTTRCHGSLTNFTRHNLQELYDWLLKEGYGDANLIAKWKKAGYEKLCCVRCIQTKVC